MPGTAKPDQPATFEALVARTRGLQPWRRVFHATFGLLFAGLLHFLAPERLLAAGVLGGLTAALLAADLVRLRWPAANRLFFLALRPFASPREATGIASSTWFVGGCAATVALFPLDVAVPAIVVLAVADPLASYLGWRWGRRRFGTGTVEGAVVFLAAAFGVLVPFVGVGAAGAAALAVTLAEAAPWPVDDNLTIPVVTGALLWGLSVFLG